MVAQSFSRVLHTPQVVNAIIVKHPTLSYYQGFHDVISVLVFVFTEDENLLFAVAEQLALSYLGDFMLRSDFHVLTQVLELAFPLIQAFDQQVGRFLQTAGVHPYVCLPWVITWWAHDCHDIDKIARLYDAFLASHPLFPLYLAAAMILHSKDELLSLEDCDFSTVHAFLSRLASREDLPAEELVVRAQAMIKKKPPLALVKASGNKTLREMVRRKEVYALRYPPGR